MAATETPTNNYRLVKMDDGSIRMQRQVLIADDDGYTATKWRYVQMVEEIYDWKDADDYWEER